MSLFKSKKLEISKCSYEGDAYKYKKWSADAFEKKQITLWLQEMSECLNFYLKFYFTMFAAHLCGKIIFVKVWMFLSGDIVLKEIERKWIKGFVIRKGCISRCHGQDNIMYQVAEVANISPTLLWFLPGEARRDNNKWKQP